jgi:hypothetical protein
MQKSLLIGPNAAHVNIDNISALTKISDATTAYHNMQINTRLTEAINQHGKPIPLTFSSSQELGGTGCCKK